MTRLSDLPKHVQEKVKRENPEAFNKKKHKYNARKTKVDGITFDSKRESEVYQELKLLKMAGEVKLLKLQPKYLLQEGFTKNGKRHRPITYIADFEVHYKDGRVEVIDVKGKETEVFKIKRKLFEKRYPDLELKIIK